MFDITQGIGGQSPDSISPCFAHSLPSVDSSLLCMCMQVFLQHAQGECERIGTAQVELSLLHIMGHVSGWYNIINARCATNH